MMGAAMAKSTEPPSKVAEARRRTLVEQNDRRRRIRLAEQDHYERTRIDDPRVNDSLHRNCKPTRETGDKLRPDPVNRMLASGGLSQAQGWAAGQIHAVYVAVSGSLLARAGTGEGGDRGRSEMADKIVRWHRDNYLPWTHYLGGAAEEQGLWIKGEWHPGRSARAARCPVALELAIDVVVEGKPLPEVEREQRWRKHGTAAEYLRYSLAVYADLAGWEDNAALIGAFEARLPRRRGPYNIVIAEREEAR